MVENFIAEFIAHEDVWIFIILIVIVANSFIITWLQNKESKKIDKMYRFIEELSEKSKEIKEIKETKE